MTVQFDYQPLHNHVASTLGKRKVSDREMGEVIGVAERQIRKARIEGLSEWTLDRWCVNISTTPGTIYGSEWRLSGLYCDDVKEGKVTQELADRMSKAWA